MSKPDSLTPNEAYTLLQQERQAVLVDIRSTMEYLFVGHPVGAVHIAWLDEPDWEPNPDFASEVERICQVRNQASPKDVPLVLICRSGKRTLEAGAALLEAGFNRVVHVNEGFEGDRDEHFHRGSLGGWRFRGLPWEQC